MDISALQARVKEKLEQETMFDKNPLGEQYLTLVATTIEEINRSEEGNAILQPDILATDVEQFNQTVIKFSSLPEEQRLDKPAVDNLEIDAHGAISELRSIGWLITPPTP